MKFLKAALSTVLVTSLAIALTVGITACGKSDDGNTVAAVPPNANPPIGSGPVGPNVIIQSCQIGQVYSPQYGCMYVSSRCNSGEGWVPNQFMCAPGTIITETVKYGTQSVNARFVGTMQVVNRDQFSLLLRYSGRCEPQHNWLYVGSARCSSWTSQGYVELRAISAAINGGIGTVNLLIGAGNQGLYPVNPYGNPYQLPYNPYVNVNAYAGGYAYVGLGGVGIGISGSTYRDPNSSLTISQQAQVFDYNNSQGMQIVATSYSGQNLGLRAIVDNGRLTSNSFQARLYFQEVHFATVTLRRM